MKEFILFLLLAFGYALGSSCDPPCTSQDPCFNPVCASNHTCILVPRCEDGDPCTINMCSIMHGKPQCMTISKCQGNDMCIDYGCMPNGTCTEEPNFHNSDPCKNVTCNSQTGEVWTEPVCTSNDTCSIPQCYHGACFYVNACDDGNICTRDICNNTMGDIWCSYENACDDGDPCTLDECCQETGSCTHTPACDYHYGACTNCTCDPMSGNLTLVDACDDGNECTTDHCCFGFCTYTDACISDDPCWKSECINGTCVGSPKCDDGNLCTEDHCSKQGICSYKPVCPCGGHDCIGYECDPRTGNCTAVDTCDDGDLCTIDICHHGICHHEPLCDDSDPCTNNTCTAGMCRYPPLNGTICDYGCGLCIDGICEPQPHTGSCKTSGKSSGGPALLIITIVFGIIILIGLIMTCVIIAVGVNGRGDRRDELKTA